jgi:hypothetical protein
MNVLKTRINKWLNEHVTADIIYDNRVQLLTNSALFSSEQGTMDRPYNGNELVVSLTTYGRRLYDVYLTIETIMRQTMKANKIILWLEEALKNTDIPLILQKQQGRGLEIKYCEDNKSYNKLIPSLYEFPEAIIITIDDDCLYDFDIIENLFTAHLDSPRYIYALRLHRMKSNSKNTLEPYSKWEWEYEGFDVSALNFPTGIGGVLYPPHCFSPEVFNKAVFRKTCEYADDVWFKAMSLMNGVLSKKAHSKNKGGRDYLINNNVQDITLAQKNNDGSKNDIQIKAVFEKYNLYERL